MARALRGWCFWTPGLRTVYFLPLWIIAPHTPNDMEAHNLQAASTYVNNILLARGLLKSGQAIDFANPENEEGGTDATMARVINLVNDLVLRRDVRRYSSFVCRILSNSLAARSRTPGEPCDYDPDVARKRVGADVGNCRSRAPLGARVNIKLTWGIFAVAGKTQNKEIGIDQVPGSGGSSGAVAQVEHVERRRDYTRTQGTSTAHEINGAASPGAMRQ